MMSVRPRVLIVDDEPSFCKVIQSLLKGENYDLHTVGCGQEAIGIIDASPDFDVVLLDLNLPDMNGFKVMGYLSEHSPETLVVIMTGYASLESATEALRCGAYDYLTKPFAREELTKTLQNAMIHKEVKTAHQHAQQALEESELCFRNLVENILSGVLIVRERKLLYQNAYQKELYGPITEVILSCDYRHIHPEDVEKLKDISEQFLDGNISKAEIDFRFNPGSDTKEGGAMKWVLSRATRISYRGENALLINTVDISRLKELERLVTIKNKMHSLGRAAAGVAHEIRNPLTGVNSYLFSLRNIIDSGFSSENDIRQAKKITEQIQSASDKIENVIKRVMDFAKPGVSQIAPTDINQTVRDAVNLSERTIRKQGIELQMNLDAAIPECHADRNLIGQMVLNLINNAVHALESSDAPRRLRVSSFLNKERVLIQVSDSGPGISGSLREKIFDPFFTTKDDGSGIGLNIVQRIVADHHGAIEVTRSEWGGAQFTVDLPVDRRTVIR
jgi:signal transduction histidine kinase/FixJ family two-component response regulator